MQCILGCEGLSPHCGDWAGHPQYLGAQARLALTPAPLLQGGQQSRAPRKERVYQAMGSNGGKDFRPGEDNIPQEPGKQPLCSHGALPPAVPYGGGWLGVLSEDKHIRKRLHLMKHGKIKSGRKHCIYVQRFTQPWLWNCSSNKFLAHHLRCCRPARFLAGSRDGAWPHHSGPTLVLLWTRAPMGGGRAALAIIFCGYAVSVPVVAGEHRPWILLQWKRRGWTNQRKCQLLRSPR